MRPSWRSSSPTRSTAGLTGALSCECPASRSTAGLPPRTSSPAWESRCRPTPTPPRGEPAWGPGIPAADRSWDALDAWHRPPGLGQKTLHRPGRDAHRFRQVLGVAPLPSLHQQPLKIQPFHQCPLTCSRHCLRATEGGRKEGVSTGPRSKTLRPGRDAQSCRRPARSSPHPSIPKPPIIILTTILPDNPSL